VSPRQMASERRYHESLQNLAPADV